MNNRTTCILGLVLTVLLEGCALDLKHDVQAGDTQAVLAQLKEVGIDAQLSPLGHRPLIDAAGHGHKQLVEALLNRGADVNATDVTGWTPLHAAAFHGDPQIVQLLLDRGAVITESNWYTPTPMTVAEKMHHHEAMELLKKAARQQKTQESIATNPHSGKPTDRFQ